MTLPCDPYAISYHMSTSHSKLGFFFFCNLSTPARVCFASRRLLLCVMQAKWKRAERCSAAMANDLSKAMADIRSTPSRVKLKSLRKHHADWKELVQSMYPNVGAWGKSVVEAFQSLGPDDDNDAKNELKAFEATWKKLKHEEESVCEYDLVTWPTKSRNSFA